MTATVRVGMVGAGRVAAHYRDLLLAEPVDHMEVVAVADPVQDRATALARPLGAAPEDDLEGVLRHEPDLVLVLTPSGRHHLDAAAALDAGRHVLVEKPIALRPEWAQELIDKADQQGVMLGVAFQNRFNPAIRALRAAVDAGRFGRLVTVSIRLRWCRYQSYYDDGWHGTWSQDGGVVNQQAIHHVDALDWICGPVTDVCALADRRANRLEAEDTLVAAVRARDGALGTIEATTAARPRDMEASLSVVGDHGTAHIGGVALNEVQIWEFVNPEPGDERVPTDASQAVPTGYGLGHLPLLRETVERLLAGRTDAPVSAHDGKRTVEVVHALYASAEDRAWKSVADGPRSALLGRNGGS